MLQRCREPGPPLLRNDLMRPGRQFAQAMTKVFEADLKQSKKYSYEMWERRPWKEKMAEKFLLPIKSQL